MKVIDLLNKIAKGEEVPNFKIDGDEYYIKNRCIFSKLDGNSISWAIYQGWLNEEIEIIKEPKKIEKISLEIDKFEDSYYDTAIIKLANKLDEIIDYIMENK